MRLVMIIVVQWTMEKNLKIQNAEQLQHLTVFGLAPMVPDNKVAELVLCYTGWSIIKKP